VSDKLYDVWRAYRWRPEHYNSELTTCRLRDIAFPDGSWYRLDGTAAGGPRTYGGFVDMVSP